MDRDNEIVLLLDNYMTESKELHETFRNAGKDYPTVVIEDHGFLPEDVISVYGFFLGYDRKSGQKSTGPCYFNEVEVPDFWEISGTNTKGTICDLSKERGRIFYAEPKHERLVRVVDWYDKNHVVRTSEHYNSYGFIYARTVFNAKGQKVNKSYFSVDGKEVIVENYVTGDIILNEADVVKIFHSKTEFVRYFLKRAGYGDYRLFYNSLSTPFFVSQSRAVEGKKDVLFWQEPVRDDIPGNMQIILKGDDTHTGAVMVQKRASYEKFMELGISADIMQPLGFIYKFKKANTYKAECLICTNSDRIAHLEALAEGLPQMHFHIAALTEMSSKLLGMGRYENVRLYPGVKQEILQELFENCDFYLDINYGSEIVSAVKEAFMHNHLLYAFSDTIHNRDCIPKEAVYGQSSEELKRMIVDIRMVMQEKKFMDAQLKLQQEWAMAEKCDRYDQL